MTEEESLKKSHSKWSNFLLTTIAVILKLALSFGIIAFLYLYFKDVYRLKEFLIIAIFAGDVFIVILFSILFLRFKR